MRKTILIAVVARVALVDRGAWPMPSYTASGVSAATATFSTDKVSPLRTASCTGADGKAFTVTQRPLHRRGQLHGAGAPQSSTARSRSTPAPSTARRTASATSTGSFRVQDTMPEPPQWPLHGNAQGDAARRLPRRVVTRPSRPRARQPECDVHADDRLRVRSDRLDQLHGGSCSHRRPDLPEGEARAEAGPGAQGVPCHVEGTISAISIETPSAAQSRSASRGPSTATCTRDAASPSTTGFKIGDRVEMGCVLHRHHLGRSAS